MPQLLDLTTLLARIEENCRRLSAIEFEAGALYQENADIRDQLRDLVDGMTMHREAA